MDPRLSQHSSSKFDHLCPVCPRAVRSSGRFRLASLSRAWSRDLSRALSRSLFRAWSRDLSRARSRDLLQIDHGGAGGGRLRAVGRTTAGCECGTHPQCEATHGLQHVVAPGPTGQIISSRPGARVVRHGSYARLSSRRGHFRAFAQQRVPSGVRAQAAALLRSVNAS